MNEPWFNPAMLGGILGSIGGVLGALVGTLSGLLVPKGKGKKLILGLFYFSITSSIILLALGIFAYLSSQPRGISRWTDLIQ